MQQVYIRIMGAMIEPRERLCQGEKEGYEGPEEDGKELTTIPARRDMK